MPTGPNPRGTLDGLLADGAGLVRNVHMRLGGGPNLLSCGNHGNRVKKVPRGIKRRRGNGNGQRHIRDGARPHVFAKKRQGKRGVPLMGGHDVGAMLSI